MAEKGTAVPSGSVSVLDFGAPEGNRGNAQQEPAQEVKIQEKGSALLANRFKDPVELEKGYLSLEQKLGKHGEELGVLRGQNQQLMDMLQKGSQQSAAPAKGGGADDKLATILDEYSKLDFVEDVDAAKKGAALMKQAISMTAAMTKDEVLGEAQNQFKSILQEKDADSIKTKFLEENPDFSEMQRTGVFQAMKAKSPLHDDFSAYYAAKHTASEQRIAELQAQLDEAQKVANLAGGDTATSKVFTRPSGAMPTNRSKPANISELKQSALAAVRRARSA